ncbi:MAG TPA: hypothetical protein VFD75_08455 [Pyrinomonadaceae bacterium]|nr:hypothetical protein [Pyrinomonadaceae bacterium]
MKRAVQYVAAIAVLLFQLVPCLAQRNGVAEIDQLVTTEMRARQIPGVAVAVLRNRKIERLKTYGFANLSIAYPSGLKR